VAAGRLTRDSKRARRTKMRTTGATVSGKPLPEIVCSPNVKVSWAVREQIDAAFGDLARQCSVLEWRRVNQCAVLRFESLDEVLKVRIHIRLGFGLDALVGGYHRCWLGAQLNHSWRRSR
jgi:hypothetical protein